MKDIYTTSTGLRLVKSFAQDESGRDHCPAEYEKNERKAKRAARRLLSSGSLEIVNGSDLVGGLAYTSSGCFAGLWNCNTEARKRGTRAYFDGIAISDDGAPVAVYTDNNQNGDEIGTIYEIIKA